jgi:hypothetical protein
MDPKDPVERVAKTKGGSRQGKASRRRGAGAWIGVPPCAGDVDLIIDKRPPAPKKSFRRRTASRPTPRASGSLSRLSPSPATATNRS